MTPATPSSPPPTRHNTSQRRAFTLLELLLVIAIIALILSILMPALSAARQAGQGAVCLANLRRLAISCQLYLDLSDGRFPPMRLSTVDGETYVNEFGAEKPRWQWFLAFELGAIITPPADGGTFGDSFSTNMNNDYFVCPSLFGTYTRDIRNGAYGYNYQYLGNSRTHTAPPAYDNFPVHENRITVPTQTVVFADSRGGHPEHGKHAYSLDPPRLAVEMNATRFGPGPSDGPIQHSPAEARHQRRANTAFADGHCEPMALQRLGYELGDDGVVIPDLDGTSPATSNNLWTGQGTTSPPAAPSQAVASQ